MAENVLQIAIVGLGWPGQQHTKVLASLPDVQLTAFADLDSERVQSFASEHGARAYSDWRALLEGETHLDALILATPALVRAEPLQACIERGIAVLCEKPPAVSVEAARPTLQLLAESTPSNGRTPFVAVGFQYRWHPLAARFRELIAGRERLFARIIVAWPVFDWVISGGAPPYLIEKARSGGPLIEQGIHFQDVLRYITGDEPVEVMALADLGRVHPTQWNGKARDAEETTVLTARHQSGMLSAHVHNWSHRGATLQLQVLGVDFDLTWDIGTGGASRLSGTMDGEAVDESSEADPYHAEIEGFVNAVRHGDVRLLRSPYADACRTLAVCEAAAQAVVSGQRTMVAEL